MQYQESESNYSNGLFFHTRSEQVTSNPRSSSATIYSYLTNLDNLILFGLLMTLFFMPLHEKLKAAGFWITLAFWLAKLYKERKEIKLWIPPLGWALLLFVGVAFLSAIFSDYHNRATRGALDALRNTLIFLILANTLNSYRQIKYVILALTGGIVIGDLAAIHKYFAIGPEVEMLSLGEKNSTAQVLSMALALLVGLVITLERDWPFRFTLAGVTALTGFVLILTYARGIWLAVLAMLVVFWVVQRDWKIPVALSVLAVAVLLGMSFSDRFSHKVASLKNPLAEPNMIGRYEVWKESIEILKEKPLLGIGLKTYGLSEVTRKYHLSSTSHAHNMFVNVAAELGIAGLIALVGWLIIYLQSLYALRGLVKTDLQKGLWLGAVGCFVILIIGGMTHPMLGSESSLILMMVLGIFFAWLRRDQAESNLQPLRPTQSFRSGKSETSRKVSAWHKYANSCGEDIKLLQQK